MNSNSLVCKIQLANIDEEDNLIVFILLEDKNSRYVPISFIQTILHIESDLRLRAVCPVAIVVQADVRIVIIFVLDVEFERITDSSLAVCLGLFVFVFLGVVVGRMVSSANFASFVAAA